MENYAIVLTTTDKKEVAEKVAKTLIGENLAACVQIISNVKSFYRWKGKIETSEEFLLFIKTKKSLFEEISQRIKSLHNYEVPEIIQLPIEKGLPEYIKWMDKNLI